MRCLHHPLRKVVGYCSVCGAFGCGECMTEHKGQFYCKKDYKPIAEEAAKKRKHDASLARKDRQRLVAHTSEGKTLRGTCYALNPTSEYFYLEEVDEHGEPLSENKKIQFEDLKAVFFVKSFDGKFDPDHNYHDLHVKGAPVVVEFNDGEIYQGFVVNNYSPRDARFWVLPELTDTNNLAVLIERTSIASMLTPQQYKEKKQEEAESYMSSHEQDGHSKEEARGDFHFEKHEYLRALKFYRAAAREDPNSTRVRKKLVSTQYNIGITQIKQHEYHRALTSMKQVLEVDPENERAQRKAAKLRDLIKRHKSHSRKKVPQA